MHPLGRHDQGRQVALGQNGQDALFGQLWPNGHIGCSGPAGSKHAYAGIDTARSQDADPGRLAVDAVQAGVLVQTIGQQVRATGDLGIRQGGFVVGHTGGVRSRDAAVVNRER